MNVDTVNYLDDLGGAEVPSLAVHSFDIMGSLLHDLNVEESTNKACSPSTRMLFLGIIIDTEKMTLELDEQRLVNLRKLLGTWDNLSQVRQKQVQSLI